MSKLFKEPQYLVQVDMKYCTSDVTQIWWYEYSFIKDVEYITYWSYKYSYKSKNEILIEAFERKNEFDKIFETFDEANAYIKTFKENFDKYYKHLNCRINTINLLQKRYNIEHGFSDVRIFDKSIDNWRYS
jgi:hypothetical protein